MHVCTSVVETIRFASKFLLSPHCTLPLPHTGGFHLSPRLLQENTFLERFPGALVLWTRLPIHHGACTQPRMVHRWEEVEVSRSQALLWGPRVSWQNCFPARNPAQGPTVVGTRASGPAPGGDKASSTHSPAPGQPRSSHAHGGCGWVSVVPFCFEICLNLKVTPRLWHDRREVLRGLKSSRSSKLLAIKSWS